MNFSFEGNYKSKRNINLGGVKTNEDKKALLIKTQNERKARERERLKLKSATKIQAFYRGRKEAAISNQHGYDLLQQKLSQLAFSVKQQYETIENASVAISNNVVTCIRQLLLLCYNNEKIPLYYSMVDDLSQILLSKINIHNSNNISTIEFLLKENSYDLDTKVWLLVLLIEKSFLPTIEKQISFVPDVTTTVNIIQCLQQLINPTLYDNVFNPVSESHEIYIRIMTHLILKGQFFDLIHKILYQQLVLQNKKSMEMEYGNNKMMDMDSDKIVEATMDLLIICLDNLNPPYEYTPSTISSLRPPSKPSPFSYGLFSQQSTTLPEEKETPLLLSRSTVLDIFIKKILCIPFLLDTKYSDYLLNVLTNKLPFDEFLNTITLYYHDKSRSSLETNLSAGLLVNITTIGMNLSNKLFSNHLMLFSQVLQLLLYNLPFDYLIDGSANYSRAIGIKTYSDSEESDVNDDSMNVDQQIQFNSSNDINNQIKNKLTVLFNNENLGRLLHQFVNMSFEQSTHKQQGQQIENQSNIYSSAIGSMANLINTLLIRWPSKKDTILNTLLYSYHDQTKTTKNDQSLLQVLWVSWLVRNECGIFDESKANIMNHLTEAADTILDLNTVDSWSILYLICDMYTRLLFTIGDDEFYDKSTNHNQLALDQVVKLSGYLKNISFILFWCANKLDVNITLGTNGIKIGQLRHTVTTLLQQIHMRDSRRPFCPNGHWLIKGLDTESFSSAVVAEEYALENNNNEESSTTNDDHAFISPFQRRLQSHRQRRAKQISKSRLVTISPRLGLLNNIPFVIAFEHRVQIFRLFVENDRRRNDLFGMLRPFAEVEIRRDHVFEDGFNKLYKLGDGLKKKISITFIDSFGLAESGIDGGGVFKEFITSLGHESFNTDYGLFSATPDQLLYPSSGSYATKPQQLAFYEFIGLIIGKALYEGILLDVAFADFFLKKGLGKMNYLDDLPSLDPELYKGLIQVKNFEGNVEDLCLDFSLTPNDAENSTPIDLIANGSNIPVTNENKIKYVYVVANYRLNLQIAKQSRAFFSGLSTIIDTKWLRMFNQQELQIMLGGASVPIDVDDLRNNTVYAEYGEMDPTIQSFWEVIYNFNNDERMKFVKFVTSCSRPPLLGFKELQPKFCIRRAGFDETRLPTSSTCVNLLKLPSYSSHTVLKEKLLYAINADAGFDLS
ncbi:unnamed protein product [Cunninghamella blakesleeana]